MVYKTPHVNKQDIRNKIKNCQTSTDRSKDTLRQTQAPQASHGTWGTLPRIRLCQEVSVTVTATAPARLSASSPATDII